LANAAAIHLNREIRNSRTEGRRQRIGRGLRPALRIRSINAKKILDAEFDQQRSLVGCGSPYLR
jgi:hypothetical protein